MSDNRENVLEQLLRDIINDFDQTGCSSGVGVVATSTINKARAMLDMSRLKDEEDEYEQDESLGDIQNEVDVDLDPQDESTP